jgi:hypothetical protein
MLGGRDARFDKAATTLWLTANSGNPTTNTNLKPFGWAVIEPLSESVAAEIKTLEESHLAQERPCTPPGDNIGEVTAEPKTKTDESQLDKPSSIGRIIEVWENAYLNWSPGNRKLTATSGNKSAMCEGKELVPVVFHKKLFDKRKAVCAKVEVERFGNAFKIVKIEAET